MCLTLEPPMAKEEMMSVKLSSRSLEVARIAAATRGETLATYASRVLLEVGNRDIDDFNARRAAAAKPEEAKAPPARAKPKGGGS